MPCRPCFIASSSMATSVSLRKSLRRSWASVVESLLTFRPLGVVLERIGTPRLCCVQNTPLLTKSGPVPCQRGGGLSVWCSQFSYNFAFVDLLCRANPSLWCGVYSGLCEHLRHPR